MSAASFRHSGPMACLLAVALTATACGSSSSKGAASTSTGTSAAVTTSAAAPAASAAASAGTSAGTSTGTPTATSAAPGAATSNGGASSAPAPATTTKVVATGGGDFCKNIANAVNNPIKPTASGTGTPKDEKALIEKSLAQGRAALSKAPAEIRSDSVVVLGAIETLFNALEKANYDYTKIDKTALAGISSPAVVAAETHLAAYVKTSCGFDLTSG